MGRKKTNTFFEQNSFSSDLLAAACLVLPPKQNAVESISNTLLHLRWNPKRIGKTKLLAVLGMSLQWAKPHHRIGFFPQPKSDPWWWVVSAICQNLLRFFPTAKRCRDRFSNSFRFYCRAGLKWYCWCTKIPAQKTLLKYTAFRQFEIKYEASFWWKYHFIDRKSVV